MSIKVTEPKKLFIIFGLILGVGIFISTFLSFYQKVFNPYIILAFGLILIYFGGIGIYKTIQSLKDK